MERQELFKTAHLLLIKHGPRIVDDIEDKIGSYGRVDDQEAVDILQRIRFAAHCLMALVPGEMMPN